MKNDPSAIDLYGLPVEGVQLSNFCGGNLGSETQQCVEVGAIPGAGGAYVLGDSKNPDAGQLRFTEGELDDFALGYIAKRGLTA
ncbi:DUF397 domain-containing protein [Micromonospora cremea]|uniref:DUF397 domain-containing protein n=1 Tax=Micromonospora cremea TaxID=709881 RepID=A0A1N5TYU9_9ACTN|nr:DUF397 domain-containing protein [Micromonospora cremea]SIM53188.1 protein of unknown function [Micromonospora cremea]